MASLKREHMMYHIEHLADAIETQTKSHATQLADDVVTGRVGLTDYVKIEVGMFLGILGRLGATEEALKDVVVRLNNLEYS